MSGYVSDMCEWDPERQQAARYVPGTDQYWGCKSFAVLIVGANGDWRLCESCAALPRFKRYRRRHKVAR